MHGRLLAVAIALLAVSRADPLAAAALDKETCDKLKEEQAQLTAAGVRASMANGPEWGKTNLKPDKLAQVARLVDVDAQVAFRCVQPRATGAEPQAEGARKRLTRRAKAKDAAAGAPATNGTAESPAATATAGAESEAAPDRKPASPRRAAAKPKANDAYAPPAAPAAKAGQP